MKSRLRLATPDTILFFLIAHWIRLNEAIHISDHDKYLYHLSPFYFLLTNDGDSSKWKRENFFKTKIEIRVEKCFFFLVSYL